MMMMRLPSCQALWNPNQKDEKERKKSLDTRERKCSHTFSATWSNVNLIRIPHKLLPGLNLLPYFTIVLQRSSPLGSIEAQNQTPTLPLDP
jgi:hypothetical protein